MRSAAFLDQPGRAVLLPNPPARGRAVCSDQPSRKFCGRVAVTPPFRRCHAGRADRAPYQIGVAPRMEPPLGKGCCHCVNRALGVCEATHSALPGNSLMRSFPTLPHADAGRVGQTARPQNAGGLVKTTSGLLPHSRVVECQFSQLPKLLKMCIRFDIVLERLATPNLLQMARIGNSHDPCRTPRRQS